MRVLVTGGTGFIGSHLVELLLDRGNEVWGLGKHTYATSPRTLRHLDSNENYHLLSADLTDSIATFDILGKDFDLIFHLAASTHVDRSFLYPREFLETNLIGTFNLLEGLRRQDNPPKLIYMSTDEVFGSVESPIMSKESDRTAPQNPYSASKNSAENYCNAWFHSFNIPVIITRSMNNFGPRQHPEKLVSKIITNCLTNTKYTLYKGNAIRGWIYVRDTCRALHFISENGELGEIYHIPATEYLSVPEVNNRIRSLMDSDPFEGFEGRRLKDDERYALDGSKLQDLGWSPTITFNEGMQKTIDWFKNNRWFWSSKV